MMNNSYYGQHNGPDSGPPPSYHQPNQNYYPFWHNPSQEQNQVGWGLGTNQMQQMQPPPRPPAPALGQQYQTAQGQHLQTSQCSYRPPLLPPPNGNLAGGFNNRPQYHQGGSNNQSRGDWCQYRPRYNQGPYQNMGQTCAYNPTEFNSDYNDGWSVYDRFPPGNDDGYGDMYRSYSQLENSEYNEKDRQHQTDHKLFKKKNAKWHKKLHRRKMRKLDKEVKKEPLWKQEKDAKKELPENNRFFCDSCDKGFATDLTFNDHIREHEKCSYEGCSYIASQRKIQQHIKLQHATGLAKKVWSVESKEDIEKWKSERKKNFPTSETIERKKRIEKEKKARGEVIETKYFGKMKGRNFYQQETNWPRGSQPLSKYQRRRQRRNNKKGDVKPAGDSEDAKVVLSETETPKKKKQEDKPYVTEEIKRLMKQRKSMEKKARKTNNQDDWGRFRIIRSQIRRLMNKNKEEMGIITKREIKMEARKAVASQSATESSDVKSDLPNSECNDENKGEVKDVIEEIEEIEEQITNVIVNEAVKVDRPPLKNQNTYTQGWFKRPPSLLEKLLANEKRHERNVILQCVHHIVNNSFFGIGEPKNDNITHSYDIEMTESSSHNKSHSSENSDDSVSNENCDRDTSEVLPSSENTDEQSSENIDERSSENIDEQSGEQSGENIDEQSGENIDEQSSENIEKLPMENLVVTCIFNN